MLDDLQAACSELATDQQADCNSEARLIVREMEKAWKEIEKRGGNAVFSRWGESCQECEQWAVDYWPKSLTYFDDAGQTNAGVVDLGIHAFGQHCWGEVRFRNRDNIGTIDFWQGGSGFWKPGTGDDAFGWEPSKDTLLIQALGNSANSGAPPYGYMNLYKGDGDGAKRQ